MKKIKMKSDVGKMIEISSSRLKIIIDSFGAELSSIKDNNDTQYLWQADPAVWKRHAPVLFPFISGLKDGKYTYDGKEYHIASHGFARDMNHDLVSKNENTAIFSLKSNNKTAELYPFDFELLTTYSVNENSLRITYTVINNDNKNMYFYIGGHTGFNCPIAPDDNFDDYYIEYEKNETIVQDLPDGNKRTLLKNERILPITHQLFDNDYFCIDYPKSAFVSLKSRKSDRQVKLDFQGCDCIAVWSPKGEAPFVCLEPWSSTPSACDKDEDLAKKARAKMLKPNEKYDFSFTVTII